PSPRPDESFLKPLSPGEASPGSDAAADAAGSRNPCHGRPRCTSSESALTTVYVHDRIVRTGRTVTTVVTVAVVQTGAQVLCLAGIGIIIDSADGAADNAAGTAG